MTEISDPPAENKPDEAAAAAGAPFVGGLPGDVGDVDFQKFITEEASPAVVDALLDSAAARQISDADAQDALEDAKK